MAIANYGIVMFMLIFVVGVIFIDGTLDNFCDYKFKEIFEIKEFEVSVGGFLSPTLINIETTNGKNKVIKLRDVYSSVLKISQGDVIECKELQKKRVWCSSKLNVKK